LFDVYPWFDWGSHQLAIFSLLAINSPVYALKNFEYLKSGFHRTTYGQNEPITYALSRFNAISIIYSLNLSSNELKKIIRVMHKYLFFIQFLLGCSQNFKSFSLEFENLLLIIVKN
jgi:hypothetical protein